MSCGTGLRQVDRLGSRFDQLKLDTTLEFLQLISSKIEGQGATGMPDVEEFFGHRGKLERLLGSRLRLPKIPSNVRAARLGRRDPSRCDMMWCDVMGRRVVWFDATSCGAV